MLAIIGESFIRSVFLEILISKGSLNEIPKRCKDLQIFDEHSKEAPSTFTNDSASLQVVKKVWITFFLYVVLLILFQI